MQAMIVVVVLLLSTTGASAMAKIFDEKTLQQMEQLKQDMAIVTQPVRIIGPEDESEAKVERLKSCMAHWEHRRTASKMPDMGDALFSMRVWRCMYRANYTIWATRCPAFEQHRKAQEAGLDQPADVVEDEDMDDDERERFEFEREQRRKEGQEAMRKAFKDMRRAYCYAKFS